MNVSSTILVAIFILIIDVIIITIDIKNKLIIAGSNKYRIIMPATVIIFIIITALSKNFKIEDIIVLIEILPLAFVGNKCGITEKGLLTNSYLTKWEMLLALSQYLMTYQLISKTDIILTSFISMGDY